MATITRQAHRFSEQSPIFMQRDRTLVRALQELIHEQCSDRQVYVRLGETAPEGALTLAEWSAPEHFQSLTQRYGDYLYRSHPDTPREAKPLQSLWAQWYFGLLVPTLMMALLHEPRALNCSPEYIRAEFHENGHPATFWLEVQEDEPARFLSAPQRMARLIQTCLQPAVEGMTQHGDINARLIWNNMGYLIYWFLGELRAQLPAALIDQLEEMLFFTPSLPDGSDNPLYRTMIMRHGTMERRSCCQRYRIPDVERCGNCTLKAQ